MELNLHLRLPSVLVHKGHYEVDIRSTCLFSLLFLMIAYKVVTWNFVLKLPKYFITPLDHLNICQSRNF